MAQKHNADYAEKPMTRDGKLQGPSRRYRRLRHPNFPAAEWASKNPLLQRGEIGIEIDTNRMKVGNGYTLWNDLPYAAETVAKWGEIIGTITDQTDLIQYIMHATDTYTHEQAIAAATWNITHNLNKYPSVTVVDSGGTVVSGNVTYIDNNTVELNFNAAFKGTAYLN